MPVAGEPVVTDAVTGLVWQGCEAGLGGSDCLSGTCATRTWASALAYCDALSWGRYSDWTLPNIKEIDSIVDHRLGLLLHLLEQPRQLGLRVHRRRHPHRGRRGQDHALPHPLRAPPLIPTPRGHLPARCGDDISKATRSPLANPTGSYILMYIHIPRPSIMAATRRAQILMEPEEYVRLEQLARRQKVSVAELIRRAIRRCYFQPEVDRSSLVSEICSMDLPLGDWCEEDITDGHDAGIR